MTRHARADPSDGRPRRRRFLGGRPIPDLLVHLRAGRRARQTPSISTLRCRARDPTCRRCNTASSPWADRTYAETFCNGGRRFDAILAELGARRIGEIMLHDASAGTMPEELAVAWAADWIQQCRKDAKLAA